MFRPKNFRKWLRQPAPKSQPLPPTPKERPLLVIGAGPAGLATLRALRERRIPVEAVESHFDIGGMWDQRNPDSGAYDSLETNASKATMSLGDPFPEDWPQYLGHELAHRYLGQYVKKFDLRPAIRFRYKATELEKQPNGSWNVTFQNLASGETVTGNYRGVIIASGFHNRQNHVIPDGLHKRAHDLEIPHLHSTDYRNNEAFRNERVLIVGTGNSAAEIAAEVCKVAKKTVLGVRTTPWIVPLWVNKTPADVFAKRKFLPYRWELSLYRWLQKKLVGHPEKDLGFPPMKHDLLEYLPVSDRGFAQAIREGKIKLSTDFANFEKADFDHIIFATGYARHYPFSKTLGDIADAKFKPTFHLFHPTEPAITFIPEVIVAQGTWPLFWEQAKAVAAYYEAELKQSRHLNEFNRRRQTPSPDYKGNLFRKADDFHVDAGIYTKLLRDFSRWILK